MTKQDKLWNEALELLERAAEGVLQAALAIDGTFGHETTDTLEQAFETQDRVRQRRAKSAQ